MSEATAAVRWLLQQAEPEARRIAVGQIVKVRGVDAAEMLLIALSDDDWRVRKEAALVAPALDRREEVVSALVATLAETVNIGLRNAAVEALVAIGADAVIPTIGALARLDADGRKLAVEVLGGLADLGSTAALVRALDDDDGNVRVAAAEALGNAALAGEESRVLATKALLDALPTVDAFLGIAALESLARLEARLPWRVVEPYAADPVLRRYAIAAAYGSREPDAVRAVARATADPSSTIAREAIIALGEVLAGATEDAALLAVARDELEQTPGARESARRLALAAEDVAGQNGALALLGLLRHVDDIPILVAALGEEVAERADLGLRFFGRVAIAPLLVAAHGAKPSVRAAALDLAVALGGADDADVRDALRAGLDDVSPELVASVVETLAPVGGADDLRRIASMVGHENDRIAAAAAHAVWELAARHVDAARALLEHPGWGHDPRALGCILLGGIASTQKLTDPDIRVLERALIHDRLQVRRAAIDALAQAGGEAAADAIVFALADEENDVRLAAVRALGLLGHAATLVGVVAQARDPVLTGAALRALAAADTAQAVAAACPLVRHPDAAIACAAIEAIGSLTAFDLPASESLACEDALFLALDHPNAEVVKLALSIVGVRPGPRSLARLALSLDHGSWEVRRVAAELLGQHKGPGAQALLRARYERERDPVVRDAIAASVSVRPPDRGDGGVVTPLRPRESDE